MLIVYKRPFFGMDLASGTSISGAAGGKDLGASTTAVGESPSLPPWRREF